MLEGKPQFVEMAGNLAPVSKSGDQLCVMFHAFQENRLPMIIRVRDASQDATGRLAFMPESRVSRGDLPVSPTCTLNLALPDYIPGSGTHGDDDEMMETQLFARQTGMYFNKLFNNIFNYLIKYFINF